MKKDQSKKEMQIDPSSGHGEVSLPFNKNQFTEFLVSLLGKPQTISKRFQGSYEVDMSTFVNLFEILNQRIYQQNDGKLIQFRATIYYSDDSSVTLNGIEHFANFNEAHPLVCEAIHLTWQYVVKFNDKDNFEKQEINISFITPSSNPRRYDFDDNPFIMMTGEGQISMSINHTARTWGADIEALLSKHIERLIIKDSKPISLIRRRSDEIFEILKILALASTLILVLYSYQNNSFGSDESSIKAINHLASSAVFTGLIYLFIKFMGIIVDSIHLAYRPSYILITKESYNKKRNSDKKFLRKWIKFLGTIIFTLLTSVAANYFYYYLTN